MALWKEPAAKETFPKEPERADGDSSTHELPRRARDHSDAKESLIASDLTIEGKIEGAGHVRIAGCFKGDVHVDGNLTIEPGARLMGEVHADTVVVGGELQGNINAAARVELLDSGLLVGDLKAGSLTVAAGSRMRGRAEFGWEEKDTRRLDGNKRAGSML